MRSRFLRDLQRVERIEQPRLASLVTQADVDALPEPARRCLSFSGAVERPQVSSLRAHAMGEMRRDPSGPWMQSEIWQYAARAPIVRFCQVRLRFAELVPALLEDSYIAGHGEMTGHPFEVLTLAHPDGEHVALNELARYVCDAVLLAPAMLLGPDTVWEAVDDATFDVDVRDHGRNVRGRVSIDERGAVRSFTTEGFLEQGPSDDVSALDVAARSHDEAARQLGPCLLVDPGRRLGVVGWSTLRSTRVHRVARSRRRLSVCGDRVRPRRVRSSRDRRAVAAGSHAVALVLRGLRQPAYGSRYPSAGAGSPSTAAIAGSSSSTFTGLVR